MSDKILMPKELTAENGAKGAFSGEFTIRVEKPHWMCKGEGCMMCEWDGYVVERETIPWSDIKQIYSKIVDIMGEEYET